MTRSLAPASAGLGVDGLSFAYRDGRDVLRDVHLAVAPGEVHCVLGSSGCGKTTLLRLIAGLERVRSGEIRVDGRVVASPGSHVPPERRPVGLVFQDFALFPDRSALRNVVFGMGAFPRHERRARAEALLRTVGMSGLEDRMPHTLSGGQQQRVALARSLATEPRVMLLDEPFSSLDSSLRARVRDELLMILRRAGVATLMVTHDPAESDAVADTVLRLDHNASG